MPRPGCGLHLATLTRVGSPVLALSAHTRLTLFLSKESRKGHSTQTGRLEPWGPTSAQALRGTCPQGSRRNQHPPPPSSSPLLGAICTRGCPGTAGCTSATPVSPAHLPNRNGVALSWQVEQHPLPLELTQLLPVPCLSYRPGARTAWGQRQICRVTLTLVTDWPWLLGAERGGGERALAALPPQCVPGTSVAQPPSFPPSLPVALST